MRGSARIELGSSRAQVLKPYLKKYLPDNYEVGLLASPSIET